jgi:hypothetical protein
MKRRAQFRVRHLMLAIVVVDLLIWPVALGRYYQGRAAEHNQQFTQIYLAMRQSPEWEEWERLNTAWMRLEGDPAGESAEAPIIESARQLGDCLQQRYFRLFEYHDAMAKKYSEAANHPWLPVAPDPAPPTESDKVSPGGRGR